MIYQFLTLSKKQQYNNEYIGKIGAWFIIASLANIAWIFLWHYEFVTISLLAMVILFISLLMIYLKLDIGLSKISLKEKIAVHATISIYLGWITVATIANVTAVLVTLNVGDLLLGESIWTILVIAVAALITILMIVKRKEIAYVLVIIWALLGIAIKRFNPDPVFGTQTNIAITAVAAMVIIILALLVNFVLTAYKKPVKRET